MEINLYESRFEKSNNVPLGTKYWQSAAAVENNFHLYVVYLRHTNLSEILIFYQYWIPTGYFIQRLIRIVYNIASLWGFIYKDYP